jgi:hypothetical protein
MAIFSIGLLLFESYIVRYISSKNMLVYTYTFLI